MNKWLLTALTLAASHAVAMDGMDSPHPEHNQWMLSAPELEWRDDDGDNITAWKVSGWYGGDTNKVTFASEGEALDDDTESHELRLGLRHAIAPYWDLTAGARRDLQPDDPSRDWGYLGVTGTAPWFIETDATVFVGEHGLSNLRLEFGYELLFTQRLILEPEVEINAYGKDDDALGVQSGLTDIEAGLRLRYEIRKQFAPYIGVHHERLLGDTRDLANTLGEHTEETLFVAGLKLWY